MIDADLRALERRVAETPDDIDSRTKLDLARVRAGIELHVLPPIEQLRTVAVMFQSATDFRIGTSTRWVRRPIGVRRVGPTFMQATGPVWSWRPNQRIRRAVEQAVRDSIAETLARLEALARVRENEQSPLTKEEHHRAQCYRAWVADLNDTPFPRLWFAPSSSVLRDSYHAYEEPLTGINYALFRDHCRRVAGLDTGVDCTNGNIRIDPRGATSTNPFVRPPRPPRRRRRHK